jgi:anion-transporting  ArsA/GET3 family ATPase
MGKRMEVGNLKVIVCSGTGGVGKTTIAAALGVKLARSGKRTLVLTIDPARRLAQALGLKGPLTEDVRVDDPRLEGRFYATMLDAQSVFDRFVRKAAPNPEIAEKLLNNHLYQQLATSLSGSQEFTSLERVLSAVESGEYDTLILDTPPSQNAVDFLRAPNRIFSLFQDSVTKWFRTGVGQKSLLAKILSSGTRTVLAALERVTGSQFIRELSDFFQQMSHLQGSVQKRSQQVQKLLTSSSTGFVLVTGFDELKLKEAMEFKKDLAQLGYSLKGMIVNRCFPDWTWETGELATSQKPQAAALHEYYLLMRRQFEHRLKLTTDLERQNVGVPLIKIPEMKTSPQGLDDLIELSERLEVTL